MTSSQIMTFDKYPQLFTVLASISK